MQKYLFAALLLAATAFSFSAFADGDAAAGKQVFSQCTLCHGAKKGENKIGPSLWDVYGRKSGSVEGYNYSDAVKKLNVTWDDETLMKWLDNPSAMAPGTKMVFRLPSEKQRKDVIAYLKTLH
jgi:cytochrome c